jgi:hypothetical protein
VVYVEPLLSVEHGNNAVCLPVKPIRDHVGKMATIAGWGSRIDGTYPVYLETLDIKIQPDCMMTTAYAGYER